MAEFFSSEIEKKVLRTAKHYDPDPNNTGYSIIIHGLTEKQSKELYLQLKTLIEEENYQEYVKLEDPHVDHTRSTIEKTVKTMRVTRIKE